MGAVVTVNAGTGELGGNQEDNIPDASPRRETSTQADNNAATSDYPDALTYERTGDSDANVRGLCPVLRGPGSGPGAL